MSELETWRPVSGYEALYEVSDMGRVKSLAKTDLAGANRREKVLSPGRMTRVGHVGVRLYKNGASKTITVHSLVLEAFVEPRPDGYVTRHLNDVPNDNRLSNLKWGTQSENNFDQAKNGKNPRAAKTNCPSGHRYSETNTIRRNGRRHCRECQRAADARHQLRKRQETKHGHEH